MKLCTKCNIQKSIQEFNRRADSKDGLRGSCKSCLNVYEKNRWIGERREVAIQRLKDRYQNKKQECSIKHKEWAQKNRDKVASIQAKRRAFKLKATPRWLAIEDFIKIREIYKDAVQLNMHVDHIIPLQGKEVCGLHVPWNLQVLEASENLKKGNRCA